MQVTPWHVEGRIHYTATVWRNGGNEEHTEFYFSEREAKGALKRLQKRYPDYTDSYIRGYDENGSRMNGG